MLPKLLAIVIATGSFAFYFSAFFVPEVHRRSDFVWSGVGMFYAVVLWFCAGQMGGAEVLGQTASVALLSWLGWQTLLLRRTTTPPQQQTPLRFGSARTAKQRLAATARPKMEYEFVEDGVAVIEEGAGLPQALPVDQLGTLVVPATVPSPTPLQDTSESTTPRDVSVAPVPSIEPAQPEQNLEAESETVAATAPPSGTVPPAPARAPSPLTASKRPPTDDTDEDWGDDIEDAIAPPTNTGTKGLLGGLRSLFGRKAKAPQPMVELPARPPSIPGLGQQKGSQPMVELPPRPPSIPGLGKKKTSQPMVELPPRPRSIPRPQKDESAQLASVQPDAGQPKSAAPANVASDTTLEAEPREGPNPANGTNADPATPEPMVSAPPANAPENEDSNWPDDASEAEPNSTQSAASAPATDVPEDEDSNWPDDDEDWI
ncbi:MAG: Ycf66 family protein [Cyanobacteria bacterium J06632_22]